MAESEVEEGQDLPALTNELFNELPVEEQEILELFAGGSDENKGSSPGILGERIIAELARIDEWEKEYQDALGSLVSKGLVEKIELGETTRYDVYPKNRDFLEKRMFEE